MTEPDFPHDLQEEEDPIQFHIEDTELELSRPGLLRRWIQSVIERENRRLEFINFVFCSDSYLHQINLDYLHHDTYTDIVTFPYREPPVVEGDIFISVERVRENAQTFQASFQTELHRVMIHGVLHLSGYLDKSPEEKKEMTNKENEALDLLDEIRSAN